MRHRLPATSDFSIQVSSLGGTRYRATVINSPAGEGSAVLELPFLPEELSASPGLLLRSAARHLRPLETRGRVAIPTTPEAVGGSLYSCLFTGDVRALFERSLAWSDEGSGRALRLKLRFDLGDPAVARFHDLPWELLHQTGGIGFLALRRKNPLVRYLSVPGEARAVELRKRLKILLVVSSPRGLVPLELARERVEIERSWGRERRRVAISVLDHPTRESLRNRLLGGVFEVLHFMGHGDLDPESGAGLLFLEDSGGGPDPLFGTDLATELGGLDRLQLVVLNACRTAERDGRGSLSPFSGVATALVQSGIPAVVAMQAPISDPLAIRFSRTFYQRLAGGDPVDQALVEARIAVHRQDSSTWDWAIPVLFMRVPDGRIVQRMRPRWPWLVLLVLLLTLVWWALPRAPGQPFQVTTEGEVLEVWSSGERHLWSHRFSGNVAAAEIGDLDGDGSAEVVVGVENRGTDTGKILAFDARGRVLWSFDLSAPSPYPNRASGKLAVRALRVAELFGPGSLQVVATAIDSDGWYPTRVVVLDADGALVGSYWHPGHLHHLLVVRTEMGAEPLVVAGGINNDLRAFLTGSGEVNGVVALRPRELWGEAPPYLGRTGGGSEAWYGLVMPRGRGIERLTVVDRDLDGRNEIALWTDNSHALYLSLEGELMARGRGDGAQGDATFARIEVSRRTE